MILSDYQRIHDATRGLPAAWRKRLWARVESKVGGYGPRAKFVGGAVAYQAKSEIERAAAKLANVRVPLDARDADICARADAMARWCMSLGPTIQPERPRVVAVTLTDRPAHLGTTPREAAPELCGPPAFWPRLAAKMCDVATSQGVEPPPIRKGARSQCARLMCPLWWRRGLRKAHARQVEGAAIALGFVHKQAERYVSDESHRRRQQQNRRNAATLARTIATNEHNQEFTLAELAAKGTANKAIRRAELMTRIAGFERIAQELGHAGSFITITCPARMHRWRTVNGGRVIENPKYDGTLPREAQQYLSKLWARARAKLAREQIQLYGFRIAEPQHDGTPHWHCLFFHAPEHARRLEEVVRHYALQDSPDERGAHAKRVDFRAIDWEKGSAAGYIAKYVAKNIDGCGLETDITGEPIMTVPQRVEAWAATWGIRQFQQVGGPPVTVWRELRRVKALPDNAPASLRDAHTAVNRDDTEGAERAADWAAYVKAQGGVFCGRGYVVRLDTIEQDGAGRYGDGMANATVGVWAWGIERVTDGIATMRSVRVAVASARYDWTITQGARGDLGALMPKGLAFDVARLAAPWTRVSNCTDARPWWERANVEDPDESLFPHLYQSWGTA
ncbi:Phage replication protein A, endonuclease [Cupriavidus sp. U2]|uniref:replication endonuclease n=1 Tax=Cupriavidus sp. U2 TaxID=2920269 RepID=UPI00129E447D|nr:replication endonuclease [Cupriavidus sp. U2]KAI3589311.1 Phage replication protein A, endonuclease [Cupriavidus sp. U2]